MSRRNKFLPVVVGLIAGLAVSAVATLPAEASTTLRLAKKSVAQGRSLRVDVISTQKSATCALGIIGTKSQLLGIVVLSAGRGSKTIETKAYSPGKYTVIAQCGAEKAASPKFTVTASKATAPTPSSSPTPSPTSSSTFSDSDKSWVPLYAQRIVDDIANLDDVLSSLVVVNSYFYLYSGRVNLFIHADFVDLQGRGMPTAATANAYKAKLASMVDLTAQLSAALAAKNAQASLDLYRQVRAGSAEVLALINVGLKSSYALPAPPSWLSSSVPTPVPSPNPTPTATPSPTAPGLSASDISAIKMYSGRIVEDITTLDARTANILGPLTSGQVGDTLVNLLEPSYRALMNRPAPPGADPAQYWARAKTLADWCERSASGYWAYDLNYGLANYVVLRQNTIPLLDAINAGLGTNFRLP